MTGPDAHCPAVHAPSVVLATDEELAPILTVLRKRGRPRTRHFPRGTTFRDGRLDFCKQGLGPDGLRAVIDALGASHTKLPHILLGTNALEDEGARVLADGLKEGLALETLYLGCNVIRSPGIAALAQGLERHDSVKALWLKRNPIGPDGLGPLLRVLPRTHIRTLDVTNCELGDDGATRLLETLAMGTTSVSHLYMGGNGLRDAVPLARWLRAAGCKLESLFLGSSRLGDDGVAVLTDALRANRSLRSLDLGSNGLTATGLRALAAHAAELSLEWLELGASPASAVLGEVDNLFGDAATECITDLCGSPLTYLGLAGTGLDSRFARKLLEALRALPAPPSIRLGKGIARRIRREASGLSEIRSAAPPDVRYIASTYR